MQSGSISSQQYPEAGRPPLIPVPGGGGGGRQVHHAEASRDSTGTHGHDPRGLISIARGRHGARPTPSATRKRARPRGIRLGAGHFGPTSPRVGCTPPACLLLWPHFCVFVFVCAREAQRQGEQGAPWCFHPRDEACRSHPHQPV